MELSQIELSGCLNKESPCGIFHEYNKCTIYETCFHTREKKKIAVISLKIRIIDVVCSSAAAGESDTLCVNDATANYEKRKKLGLTMKNM